jgi:hypothetical protein
MEVHFVPELEAKLKQSAAEQKRNPDELVQDVVSHYLGEETRLAQGSEYLTRDQRSNP